MRPNPTLESSGTFQAAKPHVNTLIVLLICYAAATSAWEATRRPLWFDEIFTAQLARLPTMADTMSALNLATDTSGPVYYWVVRSTAGRFESIELALRFPSVIAATVALVAIYLFARRDLGPVAGSVAVIIMLLSRLYHGYSVEARPYALMVMFICVGALAWQRADDRRWRLVLVASAALAVGTHYYAVFAGVPFVMAEAAYSLRRRTVRTTVWLALSTGAVALFAVRHPLRALLNYYGPNYWSKPSIGKAMATYDWALAVGPPGAGFGVALVLGLGLLLLLLRHLTNDRPIAKPLPFPETLVFILSLLALPFVVAVVAFVMEGGFAERYSLGMLAGLGLSVAYAVRALDARKQGLVAMGLAVVFGAHELVFWKSGGEVTGPHSRSRLEAKLALIDQASEFGLPIVVENGHDFVPMSYYRPKGSRPELVFLTDPQADREYIGTDSMDLDLIALKRYVDWSIVPFETFRRRDKDFLLLSYFEPNTWWSTRLVNERYRLEVVGRSPSHALYRVRAPE